jgi:hypothetical protein
VPCKFAVSLDFLPQTDQLPDQSAPVTLTIHLILVVSGARRLLKAFTTFAARISATLFLPEPTEHHVEDWFHQVQFELLTRQPATYD